MDDWLFGKINSSLVARSWPAVTTAVTAFVATLRTEITRIRVCNISGAPRTFRMYHAEAAGAISGGDAIYFDEAVQSSAVFDWQAFPDSGISMMEGGMIAIRSDQTQGLVFSFYGKTQARSR